ncbi:MAG: QueT transporter family protein [Clostridia bacterium]|nr:QueT transporter family protein [Clostridia bacterium]
MKNLKNSRFLVQSASIAAIYVTLTFFSSLMGLSSGIVQLRLSEALCVLPAFTPAAIPGLFVGCILANTMTGSIFIDIIFGSLATLVGAVFTRTLRRFKVLSLIPPILSNTLILPFVLKFAYNFEGSIFFFMATICCGEILSCGVLGYILRTVLDRYNNFF